MLTDTQIVKIFSDYAREFHDTDTDQTSNEFLYFINDKIQSLDDPMKKDLAYGVARHEGLIEGGLVRIMMDTGLDFDISYPKYAKAFRWSQGMQVWGRREAFCFLVDDNDLIKTLIGNDLEAIMIANDDRGGTYIVLDHTEKTPYIFKPLQQDKEKDIIIQTDGIGPKVYCIGNRSLLEEFLGRVDIKGFPKVRYSRLDQFSRKRQSRYAAEIFARLHKKDIVYNAHNWHHEMRIRVGFRNKPKIVDFGWSYIDDKGSDFIIDIDNVKKHLGDEPFMRLYWDFIASVS